MLDSFHPAVRTWFARRFPDGPTAPQAAGWREIAAGRHTLIAAPTGSGKTLAAFAVFIDQMYTEYTAARAASHAEGAGGAGHAGRIGPGAGAGQLAGPGDAAGGKPAAGGEPAAGTGAAAGPRLVYVSPLKALAADIWENLQRPLAEIAETAAELGLPAPPVRVAVRTGDTAAAERAAMLKRPPDFLVTTPESLYLLVTAERSRSVLRAAQAVIVDEIHAVAGNKRGSHLALTLERLEHLAGRPVQRIGLSATQRPIETVARLLVGAGPGRSHPDGSPRCAIVDTGQRRTFDLALQLPGDELGAVATADQMAEILDLIAAEVAGHRTTLVFVNARWMAERVAHQLGERLGEGLVAAHHGSLSAGRRQRVEARLRAGDLRALVATASLELGIDIGPVDLVCQIGSPRSFATFAQRVGRSNHHAGGIPAGRLYPTTRDELVECAAVLRGMRAGRLDALLVPACPLDILAQQMVAECATGEWAEDELMGLARRAAPFAALSPDDFADVTEMLSEGIRTGRGRRAAWLHHDQVSGLLRGRRGARLAALTSGGAIPELGDYRVLAEPGETPVGMVNEEWALESAPGDVFLLGTTSWRIRRIEPGTVRVEDAHGAPPSVPVWHGEGPGRTRELSEEVCAVRAGTGQRLADGGQAAAAEWLKAECGIGDAAAATIAAYLGAGLAQLGVLPTMGTIVLERFFDDAGGMQLVGHTPFGARLNRALGLALRKRFCVTFDFELQAAASDDAILLSLGPQHSFPLDRVPKFLTSKTVEEVVRQAVLTSPMFAARWRWNLNRALTVLRMRGGKKNPPAIQRMESDDLLAAVFPVLAACQENVAPGPMEIPSHPLVRQTMDDCLREAMDIDGLRRLLAGIESGEVSVVVRDTTEPSVLAHEILNGRPFTFLDDAGAEDRRSRTLRLPRGLPVEPHELGRLDPAAIARVSEQVQPAPRDPDELHDLLLATVACRPCAAWQHWFAALVTARRAACVHAPAGEMWFAVERKPAVEALFPGAPMMPDHPCPVPVGPPDQDVAAADALRGHLDCRGPSTAAVLAQATGLPEDLVDRGLARLEAEGFALRGHFTSPADSPAPAGLPGLAHISGRTGAFGAGGPTGVPASSGVLTPSHPPATARPTTPAGMTPASHATGEEEFCARRLLARIHSYSRQRRRREIEPVTARDFIRFLLRWQHLAPGTRREGRFGVLAVIEQLQGYELAAGAWEQAVLAARVTGYRREWLDEACLSGQVAWGRLSLRDNGADPGPRRSGLAPSRATPITLALRDDLPWLLRATRGGQAPAEPGPGRTQDVLDALRQHGALFRPDLATRTGRLPSEVDEALWEGVALGLVTADGFRAIRSLLRRPGRAAPQPRAGLRRGLRSPGTGPPGRWTLLPAAMAAGDPDELAEAAAEQLIARWGVLFRDLARRENLTIAWRDLLWACRRLEARGTIRGGRFVSGFSGEQFAHPDALDVLRTVRRQPHSGETIQICAADPVNLTGVVLPGPRIPAVHTGTVTYVDGAVPDAAEPPAAAGAGAAR